MNCQASVFWHLGEKGVCKTAAETQLWFERGEGGRGVQQSAHGKGPEIDWPPERGKITGLEREWQSQAQSISRIIFPGSVEKLLSTRGLGNGPVAPLCPPCWRRETGTGHKVSGICAVLGSLITATRESGDCYPHLLNGNSDSEMFIAVSGALKPIPGSKPPNSGWISQAYPHS